MQYKNLKKIIFKTDPENAHYLVESTLSSLSKYIPFSLNIVSKKYRVDKPELKQDILGIKFPNPIGLAAGFDKNATMLDGLAAIGFGFIEFGTVTPKPQDGNPKPRLFRFPEANSLQNAMGFNNNGLEKVKEKIKKDFPFKIPLGANIGKNKLTSQEDALEDYRILIEGFKDISDYIVINISSPNTPGLRDLQNEAFIKSIFEMGVKLTDKPIFLKIAPDLEIEDAIEMCQIAIEHGAKGIIATNTTIDYSLLPNAKDFGGVSGAVLKEKSFKLFEALAKEFYGKTILISVGGISDADEAYKRIRAGASLIQVFTSLIFEGPSLIKNINNGLIQLLKKDGFENISQAIGADRK